MKLNQKGALDLMLVAAIVVVLAVGSFVLLRISDSDDTVASTEIETSSSDVASELTATQEPEDNTEVVVQNEETPVQEEIAAEDQSAEWAAKIADQANFAVSPDPEFQTISPDCGILDSSGMVKLRWSSHKDATRYVVRVRKQHKTQFPLNDLSTTVDFGEGELQPDIHEMTVDFEAGENYFWAVSAERNINLDEYTGFSTIYQLTDDCSYQS